jgi:dipeptidyl aminopeptidase/acylaminoacyl peptidase
VIIAKGNAFSRIRKDSKGRWSEPVSIGETEKLSNVFFMIAPSTNGRIVVGVTEGPTQPTEIAAFDLKTRTQTVLTDFNEPARKLAYAPVEKIDWKGVIAGPCTGYLFRPIGYEPGRRYPLAILLDDGVLSYGDPPFMIAGGLFHLSAHPVQALAASGIAVLYTREPSILRDVVETAKEGPVMMDHVESAIAHLDRIGLVDPARVGVSGWSRAGYYTDYIIIHARHRLAAALSIDGGTDEYNPAGDYHDGSRPFTDEELKSIRTPLLAEAHGLRSLIGHGKFIDRLKALGRQVELLYFPTASHSTERPSDRMSSLGIALDWFRFWLQDYEDPDEAKARQYERWRELRKLKSNTKD